MFSAGPSFLVLEVEVQRGSRGGRPGQAAALPLWTLPSPGFRVGAKEKIRLSVSPVSLPSHSKMPPIFQPPLLESLPPLGCLTSHVQIHLVVGTVGVDGTQHVFPNLVSISSGITKKKR